MSKPNHELMGYVKNITVFVPEDWLSGEVFNQCNILEQRYLNVGGRGVIEVIKFDAGHYLVVATELNHRRLADAACNCSATAARCVIYFARKYYNATLAVQTSPVEEESNPLPTEDTIPGPTWVEEPRGTSGFEWL